MKRPLGRGLENLMPADSADSDDQSALDDSPAGVDRLIHGNDQGEGSTSLSDLPPLDSNAERVPSWVFYLADLILLSAVLWITLRNPQPTRGDYLMCFLIVIIAASMGIWPWLRNVLNCDGLGEAGRIPKWVLAPCVKMGGEPKCLIIHTRRPFVAVEVTETSWKGVNTKPYWIDGPPNLAPGGVKALLSEAARFYQISLQEAEEAHLLDCEQSEKDDPSISTNDSEIDISRE